MYSYGVPAASSLVTLPHLIIRPDSNLLQTTIDIMQIPLEKAHSNQNAPQLQSKPGDTASQPLPKPIKKRDRSSANFRNRWRTLVKTGCELHQDYGARVYFSISIPRTRKDFVFRSGKEVSPILPSDLVNNISPTDGIAADDERERSTPHPP
jgi:hypothetical protein